MVTYEIYQNTFYSIFQTGLRLSDDSDEYQWTDGRPLSYSDWLVPKGYSSI